MSAVVPGGHLVERLGMGMFLRILAWLYDFFAALFITGWVFWQNMVLGGCLGCSRGEWAERMAAWEETLYKCGKQQQCPDWLADGLHNMPWILEWAILLGLSAWVVRLFRRMVRVTPGEWTFSVRRSPMSPPTDGAVRTGLRTFGGLAALCLVIFLWSLLDWFVLNPI